jgi:hypothetical protein
MVFRRPWLRSQVLASLEKYLDRGTDFKAVIEFYYKTSVGITKERAVGTGQMAQKPQTLFTGQFISCKGKQLGKCGHSLQEELG